MRTLRTVAVSAAVLALAAGAVTGCAAAGESTPAGAAACTKGGGVVVKMQPTYDTNSQEANWVKLGDPVSVCKFETLGDKTRMYVDLTTISSKNPTLAALAYLAKPTQPKTDNPSTNPSFTMCTAVGGAVAYGTGQNSGGLSEVTDNKEDHQWIVTPCVFADGSFMDSWGLAYFSAGTTRGVDLRKVFAFDQKTLPKVPFDTSVSAG